MADPDYFTGFNPDLLRLIPPDAGTVLEVGCGAGALAREYRRINPGVKWYAIEFDSVAAHRAREHCTQVWCGPAEKFIIECVETSSDFDVLVFGDVLEHLIDPWKVLKRLSKWVKPGGQILASIPNVGHFSIILGLLHGEWRYADSGLLDRTHLRFFTLRSIRELFEGAGLQVWDVIARRIEAPEAEKMFRSLVPGTHNWEELLALQYLVRAIRSDDAPAPLHIHAVLGEACCARPRILEPFTMLGTIPGVRCTTPLDRDAMKLSRPQILIQQRFRGINLGVQRDAIEAGYLIIAEIDDDPEHLQGIPESDFLPLRAVHAVQTTTEVMAETIRRWNPHVAVFPNQIADLPPWEEKPARDRVSIFYGAQNRADDWAPIMPALNWVLNSHPNAWVQVVHDRAFFEALETDRKAFHPFTEYANYRRILRLCDIALLPLEPSRHNRHKSDLKFIECAAEWVAVLASSTVYGDAIFDGRSGLIYHPSPMLSFEDCLCRLIENGGLRHALADHAYAYVRDRRLLSQHYRRQHEWYVDLLKRKPELDRSIFARVPELAPAFASASP